MSKPAQSIIADGPHRIRFRVYYEDTDAGGVVYYANYLKFAERARTEMMHALGDDYAEALRRGDLAFAVRKCEIDYLAPARLDDIIEVESRVIEAGGARLSMRQVCRRDGEVLAELSVLLACIDGAGGVSRIPEPIRAALFALVDS